MAVLANPPAPVPVTVLARDIRSQAYPIASTSTTPCPEYGQQWPRPLT